MDFVRKMGFGDALGDSSSRPPGEMMLISYEQEGNPGAVVEKGISPSPDKGVA